MDHTITSFKTFLLSIGQRGLLEEFSAPHEVLRSMSFEETDSHLIWVFLSVPKDYLQKQTQSRLLGEQASWAADPTLHQELWDRYLKTEGQLDIELSQVIRSIWIEAYESPPGRLTVDMVSNDNRLDFLNDPNRGLKKLLDFIISETSERQQQGPETPPEPPEINAHVDLWFDWYHVMTEKFQLKMSLKDLANKMGLSYTYVRKLHSDYMEQYRTDMEQK